jgi:predicted nucleotidyltransferase
MQTETIKTKLAAYKPVLAERYGVKEIGIFGSYVRGEQQRESDVDILVDFTGSISLLDFVHLENELGDLLGVKVDLVMKTALKPRIGRHILEEVVPV